MSFARGFTIAMAWRTWTDEQRREFLLNGTPHARSKDMAKVSEAEPIDWHAILIKYIRHVGRSEGVDFLGNGHDTDPCNQHGHPAEPCFTDTERDALLEAARG